MNIIGIGTDIADLTRIEYALARDDNDFIELVCTPAELVQAAEHRDQRQYFGTLWAAKEALAKALGCGIGSACHFSDVEIYGIPERIKLSGAALETLTALGGKKVHLALAAEKHYATATVIITA